MLQALLWTCLLLFGGWVAHESPIEKRQILSSMATHDVKQSGLVRHLRANTQIPSAHPMDSSGRERLSVFHGSQVNPLSSVESARRRPGAGPPGPGRNDPGGVSSAVLRRTIHSWPGQTVSYVVDECTSPCTREIFRSILKESGTLQAFPKRNSWPYSASTWGSW